MSGVAYWSPFEVSSVVAAERAGRLPETLRRLAGYFEKRGRTRDRIGNALIYPALVLHAAVLLPPLFLLFRDDLSFLGHETDVEESGLAQSLLQLFPVGP